MPNRIGDRPARASNADLADAFDAERVDVRIVFVDEDRLKRRHVCIDRNVVLRQVGVHDATRAPVDDGMLMEGEGDAPDHAAEELALDQSWIDHPPRAKAPTRRVTRI